MRLTAHIDAVFQDRHEALRDAVADFESALSTLEAKGGRVGEAQTPSPDQPRWGVDSQDTGPKVREHATPPLRLEWNAYVAELTAHLDREEALLPSLAEGLGAGQVDAEVTTRKVTALMAEHEALRARTLEVRRAFLRVLPLVRAFAEVEAEFQAHTEAEDAGVFLSLLQCAESGLDLDDTPTTGRYRLVDPTSVLRQNLAQRPDDPTRDEEGWLAWFKSAFTRRKRIRY